MLHHNTYGLHVHVPQHIKSNAGIIMIKAEEHVGAYVPMQNVGQKVNDIVHFRFTNAIIDYHTKCIYTKWKVTKICASVYLQQLVMVSATNIFTHIYKSHN